MVKWSSISLGERIFSEPGTVGPLIPFEKLCFGRVGQFRDIRIAALFFFIFFYLCLWQSMQSWKKIDTLFCRSGTEHIYWKFSVQHADQHETGHELYRTQKKNKLSGKHNQKNWEEKLSSAYCGNYQSFSEVGF